MNTKINLNEVISFYVFNKPYYLSKISLVLQQWCSNTILMVFKKKKKSMKIFNVFL